MRFFIDLEKARKRIQENPAQLGLFGAPPPLPTPKPTPTPSPPPPAPVSAEPAAGPVPSPIAPDAPSASPAAPPESVVSQITGAPRPAPPTPAPVPSGWSPPEIPKVRQFEGGHLYIQGGMGNVVKLPVRSVKFETKPYAQYPAALHVEVVQKGKRKPGHITIDPHEWSFAAYVPAGTDAPDPDSPWRKSEGRGPLRVQQAKYNSADPRWVGDFKGRLPDNALTWEDARFETKAEHAARRADRDAWRKAASDHLRAEQQPEPTPEPTPEAQAELSPAAPAPESEPTPAEPPAKHPGVEQVEVDYGPNAAAAAEAAGKFWAPNSRNDEHGEEVGEITLHELTPTGYRSLHERVRNIDGGIEEAASEAGYRNRKLVEEAKKAKPAPKPDEAPVMQTQVKPHLRTDSRTGKVSMVAGHTRHFDPMKATGKELQALAAKGGDAGQAAQAEIDRRAANRAARGKRPIQQDAAQADARPPAPAGKMTVDPERVARAARADADPTAPMEEGQARALAAKLREKGQALIDKHQAESERYGNENTARRANMGEQRRARHREQRRARHRAHAERGQRMVKFAEAIEEGRVQPTGYDAAMFSSERHYNLAKHVHRRESDVRALARGGVDYLSSSRMYKTRDDHTEYIEPLSDRDPENAKFNRALRSLKRYQTNQFDREGYKIPPTATDAIAKLQRALKDAKGYSGNITDRLRDLKAKADLGFVQQQHHSDLADRFGAMLEATGPAAARAEKWAPPDRSGARDAFADRMARAEQDEAKRWKDPAHKGIAGYFPTPAPVVEEMVERADIRPGMSVLEPSAGTGDIADRLPGDVSITVAEHNQTLRGVLGQKGYQNVQPDALSVPGTFDRVVMNPPFENGQDMAHVLHAFEHNLKPGGKLVAIVSSGALQNSRRANDQFREFVSAHRAAPDEHIDPKAWKRSGTQVGTVMITLEKPHALAKASRAPGDLLPGGRADDMEDEDFDPDALEEAEDHEMEHTDDPDIAREIGRDRLAEDPRYYVRLDEMESRR